MADFKKRLSGISRVAITDPVKLYDNLDREHDKGPLRPAQEKVLNEWYNSRKSEKDVIVKLHTGQGKTLIGLLILLSRLNEKKEPVLYLCPNNYLVEQTCAQAKQFGIATCTTDSDLPDDFLDGKRILITSVKKMFNGLTKFRLNHRSIHVGTILMDDAHACSDLIRESFRIRIPKDEAIYSDLKAMFSSELESQGVGSFADINNGNQDSLLPIPYWAWLRHESEVAQILSKNNERNIIKYVWPILKDYLGNCQATISGSAIEIEPYVPPLEVFGSFINAEHRVFMSATVTDDSFLIKGLQLSSSTIANPLTFNGEHWSGEKMVLIPSLIDESLNRTETVNFFAIPRKKRAFGTVALVPSFHMADNWGAYKAKVATNDTIKQIIEDLQHKNFENTIVLVNRYDGIDLPDETCRILIFDSCPYSESLIDSYHEFCRPESEMTRIRMLRTIEQGLGRSVRGPKDYSVIVITGTDLTRILRANQSKRFLSSQMATQIDIGHEVAELAREEIASGVEPRQALTNLIIQCLKRDEDWKEFYKEKMKAVKVPKLDTRILRMYEIELKAEKKYIAGDYSGAVETIQKALDSNELNVKDKGWYLQEMARFNYTSNRTESNRLQIAAFNNNRLLLKPASGITMTKLAIVSQGRMERIIEWVTKFENYEQLNIVVSDILGRLVFGTKADKFEQALDELSRAIGFIGERPDKEWKEGPDNLWALDDTNYIVWECKDEVFVNRAEINKDETEQMNKSNAWFIKHYPGCDSKNILIHPANKVASAASFLCKVEIMRVTELARFIKNVKDFFKAFEKLNFNDLSVKHTQDLINTYKLTTNDLLNSYTKKLYNSK